MKTIRLHDCCQSGRVRLLWAFALLLLTSIPFASYAIEALGDVSENRFDAVRTAGVLEPAGLINMPGSPASWQAFRRSETGSLGLLIGTPLATAADPMAEKSLETASLQVMDDLVSELNFAGSTPFVAQILHGRGLSTVLLRFEFEDTDLYGSYAAVVFNAKGEIVSIKGEGFGGEFEGTFSANADYALNSVETRSELAGVILTGSRKVWFPVRTGAEIIQQAAWEMTFTHANPSLRPVVFVDASSGEILSIENRVFHEEIPGVTRGLYRPFRPSDQPVVGVFPEENVRLNGGQRVFSGLDGRFTYNVNPGAAPFVFTSELAGRWVNVEYEDGADASFSIQLNRIEPVTVEWTANNSRDDERMLFFHTNLIHSYWKGVDPNFRGMDRVIPATCEYGENYDNAFWNGQGMYFGNGPTLGNLALKADVIHHEFTHGVTGSIYPHDILPYEGESGALNEAWSDYFPCSISDEPYIGETNANGAGSMRNLDNNLVYPRDWFGEVHYDSRMISAAMWHSREVLGREITDPLFHFAKFQLGNDFIEYFTDILLTDDDDGNIMNGTPHDLDLYEQFGRHGIGPGIVPIMSFTQIAISDSPEIGGDNDRLYEPGESFGINVELLRDGTLFPPPAGNVTVTLTSSHPSLDIVTSAVGMGAMRVGDRVAADRPLLVSIADDAPLSFATLYLTVSADGYENLTVDTIRIAIGRPSLLLVRDAGEGDDRTDWYRRALDRRGVVYGEFSVAAPHVNFDSWLEQFENVIWFTGDAKRGFLREVDQEKISRFIQRGGNILLTGQSIGAHLRNDDFLAEYFGTRVTADSIHQVWLEGVAGDPIGDGMRLLLQGARGAMNQFRPAAIEATGDGVEVLHWTRLPGSPAGGVRLEHESGAKTLFLSFGAEGVGGHGETTTCGELLAKTLLWFGMELAVKNELPATPAAFSVGAPYPNPFNGLVTVPFTLTRAGEVRLSVYDLTGRLAYETKLTGDAGPSKVLVDASNLGSGVYSVRIEAEGIVENRRVTLIR